MVESACQAEGPDSIPGSGRPPGEGNDNWIQYSYLENPTDGGAWWATVPGVAESRTRLTEHAVGPQVTEKPAPWDG